MTVLFRSEKVRICFLVFATLLLLIPFSNKAVSTDATFYIYTARQILRDPLRPFDFSLAVAGGKIRKAWEVANNPPLGSYLMAGVISIFGEKEIPLHLFFFLFSGMAVIGVYLLAREFGIPPMASALALLSSPAFFVNSTDIMLDVPMLSLSLLGLYLVFSGERKGSYASLLAGWLLISASVLIKFVALLNIFVVFIGYLVYQRPWRRFALSLIPVFFLLLWCLHNLFFYGEVQILGRAREVGLSMGLVKEIPLMSALGGALIFPPSIFLLVLDFGKRAVSLFLAAFAIFYLFFLLLEFQKYVSFLLAFFICCGFSLLASGVVLWAGSREHREILLLVAWFFIYGLFFACVSAILAVRYLLPLLPVVVMLFAYACRKRVRFLSCSILASLILSLGIAHADMAWANSYRNMANYVRKNHGDRKVYFTGYLGFQYYMEKNGFISVVSEEKNYSKGGLWVTSSLPVPQSAHPSQMKRLRRVETVYARLRNPMRTLLPSAQAGFHLNLYGLLPYSVSRAPLERFELYEIE